MNNRTFKIFLMFLLFLIVVGCGALKPSKVDTRKTPVDGRDRALQNLEQGKGLKLSNLGKEGRTNYEFSTSNPMWRATLETIDFIPMTTVDYSGGIIITDWYSDLNSADSLKITVRFLSNSIAPESLKIIIHKKNCKPTENCSVTILNSNIKEELAKTILVKAATFEAEQKLKK